MKWKRAYSKVEMTNEELPNYLASIFDEELAKGKKLIVAVGTDSQRAGRGYRYATVILIRVEGNGGMVISRQSWEAGKPALNERMLKEVGKSIEVAYEIAPLLDLYGIPLEIHADINPDPKWESNASLKEAVGYILGMGYDFKIKPDAWAASNSADKIVNP